MSKYIDAEKLIAEIDRQKIGYNTDGKHAAEYNTCRKILDIIVSLQQEQPDNEDIDKVAQELYEHLYELKRRNNVPTNLYDKKEIIELWKAGIEYGRNHPNKEQPSLPSNLDEAAEEYAPDLPSYIGNGVSIVPESRQDLRDAFKAGAEWMAGQFIIDGELADGTPVYLKK